MLNKKNKKLLISKSMTMTAGYQIGKNGISENTINLLSNALDAHELIKISVLNNVDVSVNEIALDLSSSLHADIVEIIGNKIVLYRFSKRKDINHIL